MSKKKTKTLSLAEIQARYERRLSNAHDRGENRRQKSAIRAHHRACQARERSKPVSTLGDVLEAFLLKHEAS